MFQSGRDLRFNGLLLGLFLCAGAFCWGESMPNIVVILTDDQGYGDISFNPHHRPEISTPNMDSLAADGVFFSQAYISGNVCSPTRAGLMLGRYQQRVGVYGAGEGGSGFDLSNHIFPWFLPVEYTSGAFGKWHLGTELQGWGPCDRGFDESYNFLGRGAHDYYDLSNPESPLYRCETVYPDIGYLTTRLTEEAVAFIENHKTEPFFLYLAYNAVHSPAQAPQADIDYYSAMYPELSETRKILLAMLKHLDLGVGQVVQKLKDEGLWDNTLLFFLTDNGGARGMDADCSPLRGNKSTNWEGGIRTPFVVSWPNEFSGGRILDTPVISLDILPTVFDVLGMDEPNDAPFDGKTLLPLLRGETTEHHQALYWGEGGDDGGWAIRAGDWKLIGFCEEMELYDLATDPNETTNVAAENPAKVVQLALMHDAWIDQMGEPIHNEDKKCAAYYALCQGFDDPYDYDDSCVVDLPDLLTLLGPWLVLEGNDMVEFGSFSRHWFNSGLVGWPVANAGPDRIVQDADQNGSESFTLNGNNSYDPDGTIESYVWKENGSQIATGAQAVVEYPLGTHSFTLEVTDDDGNKDSDTVDINVIILSIPHASAGPDQSIEDEDENGTETVTLDGSGSY
ncbi:MAG: sulfatase-like hydrolase/transferase, partial [Planctomycetes bacterium]|nr:sulfatase-like hydrolase/transferase [Planctomycetota bacterium]